MLAFFPEISRLKQEIKRLENEFQKLLDHTIESDTRLLEYTDQVFPVNKSRVNQIARASATVDCGVQCEPNPSPPGDPAPATVDSGVQCDLREQLRSVSCAENTELLRCFKTTIEVLEAENKCLKQQNTCESASLNSGQPWTEVKNKIHPSPLSTKKRFQTLSVNLKTPTARKPKGNSFPQTKKKKTKFPKNQQYPQNAHFKSIFIRGDSHARHNAGLVRSITGPTISVGGVCLPGAGLLDVVGPRQMSTESGTRCEVLMAGTNDLAVGKQNNIYSHLETYITARPINTDIVLVTLPHRHDLVPDHSIHDETALVYAYIEELAIRHNIKVLNFNRIGRRHFTRHGMHLSMWGKRILAGMIVESLALLRPVPPEPEKPLLVTAVPPAAVPPPAANPGSRMLPLNGLQGSILSHMRRQLGRQLHLTETLEKKALLCQKTVLVRHV
ncbi:hypothetical protein J6590_083671 [Homalodisca vitripennis]|nr:hypothetical protein J6590_083671 [Homalodisca vitripennis]